MSEDQKKQEKFNLLIGQGDIEGAIVKLEKHAVKNHHKEELQLLSARFSEKKRELREGIISNNDYDVTRNRITKSLLTLVTEIFQPEKQQEPNCDERRVALHKEYIITIDNNHKLKELRFNAKELLKDCPDNFALRELIQTISTTVDKNYKHANIFQLNHFRNSLTSLIDQNPDYPALNQLISEVNSSFKKKLRNIFLMMIFGISIVFICIISIPWEKPLVNDPHYEVPKMLEIPAGSYPIGTSNTDRANLIKMNIGNSAIDFSGDLLADTFSLQKPFRLSKYEISVKQYAKFVEHSGHPAPINWNEQKQNPDLPIVLVSHNDALSFCAWLSNQTGKTFRLPTDKEWEIAAQGKDKRIFPWGNDLPNKSNVNFAGVHIGPVAVDKIPGSKSLFGHFNMAGNVAEWCETNCKTGAVIKGGSFQEKHAIYFRCADRRCLQKKETLKNVGFRIAEEIK